MFWLELYDSEALCFGDQNTDALLNLISSIKSNLVSLFKN